jgi:hypothetical protein
MSQNTYNKGKLQEAAQDGLWDFIMLLAAIYADMTILSNVLIYQGKLRMYNELCFLYLRTYL